MQDSQAVEDWLRIHRQLVVLEASFTDLAIQAAAGEISLAVLAERRSALVEMRQLCTAAYERAFPGRAGSAGPGS